jgi:hypothetical protein
LDSLQESDEGNHKSRRGRKPASGSRGGKREGEDS